jgi:hypothetical protein
VIVATRQKRNCPFFMHFYNLKQTKNKRKKESSLDLFVQICQTSLESKKERKKQHAKPKEFYFLVFELNKQKCQNIKCSQDSQQVTKKKGL